MDEATGVESAADQAGGHGVEVAPAPAALPAEHHGGEHHADGHHADEHDGGTPDEPFNQLDRSFGKAIMAGYIGGFLVIAIFLVIVFSTQSNIPTAGVIAAALAVAFWMGILGGAVAVGRWATKHEEELHEDTLNEG